MFSGSFRKVCWCVCMSLCVFGRVIVSPCVFCVCMHACACVFLFVRVCVCVCVYLCVHVCLQVYDKNSLKISAYFASKL